MPGCLVFPWEILPPTLQTGHGMAKALHLIQGLLFWRKDRCWYKMFDVQMLGNTFVLHITKLARECQKLQRLFWKVRTIFNGYREATLPTRTLLPRVQQFYCLSVLFPVVPKFIVAPPSIMTRRVGDDVTLVCEATSESPPELTWKREGVSFPEGRTVIQGGKLVITAIQKDDYGVYTCIATSEDGQAEHSTTIAVLCKLNELLEVISTTEIMALFIYFCCISLFVRFSHS